MELAQAWHREIFDGISLPVSYYAGEIRDDDPRYPELVGYEVAVGQVLAVAARRVPTELERFENRVRRAVGRIDSLVPPGQEPPGLGVLGSVITLCAVTHGEWVRIHPFANGNGRVARLWTNWCALRYGLPPFVRLRPRPAGREYARAATDSMRGDHRAAASLFTKWLEARLREGAPNV